MQSYEAILRCVLFRNGQRNGTTGYHYLLATVRALLLQDDAVDSLKGIEFSEDGAHYLQMSLATLMATKTNWDDFIEST